MPRLRTGTQGEHLVTKFWRVAARLVVTCLSNIKPVTVLLIVRLWSMRCCGNDGGVSWEEYGPEIYIGKRK